MVANWAERYDFFALIASFAKPPSRDSVTLPGCPTIHVHIDPCLADISTVDPADDIEVLTENQGRGVFHIYIMKL